MKEMYLICQKGLVTQVLQTKAVTPPPHVILSNKNNKTCKKNKN